MTGTYETTLVRDDGDDELEIPVLVEYAYHGAIRGKRDSILGKPGAGPQLEPDEQAYVEVERVYHINDDGKVGEEIDDCTAFELSQLECRIMEYVNDRSDYNEDDWRSAR